jgi:Family of unknown function (DUF6627)
MEGFMRSSSYFKTISRILILAMLHLCWLTSYGYAEMVPTESANQSTVQEDRQRLLDLLDRQEVIDELGKYNISKEETVARINSLTDEEVVVIAGKLDELSEGGQVSMGGPIVFVGLVILPGILLGVFYVAFLPIAAGTCIFVEDTWKDCMGDYWEFYAKPWREIYGISKSKAEAPLKNECTKNCGDQWTSCIGSKEYNEEFLEIRRQCNIDNANCLNICQIEEEEEKRKTLKEGEVWCRHSVTNEYYPCTEEQRKEEQRREENKLKKRPRSFFPPKLNILYPKLKEGQKWCQHPDTKEYYPCEVKENKVEEFLEEKEKCKEGEQWFQNPDTNEWIPCEEPQQ